jgi:GntR family transcriptional regulator
MKMFTVISPLNPEPMYKQVTDQVKDAIAAGSLKLEDKLPSIREMSKELKISMITIKRAFSDLESEGYIFTRPGLGSFVAGISQEKLREEKLTEITREVQRILTTGEKVNISADDVISIVRDLGEKL